MLKIPTILSNALLTHWVSVAEGFQPTAEILDEEKLVADLCCVSSLMAKAWQLCFVWVKIQSTGNQQDGSGVKVLAAQVKNTGSADCWYKNHSICEIQTSSRKSPISFWNTLMTAEGQKNISWIIRCSLETRNKLKQKWIADCLCPVWTAHLISYITHREPALGVLRLILSYVWSSACGPFRGQNTVLVSTSFAFKNYYHFFSRIFI